METKLPLWITILAVLITIFLVTRCEPEPITKTKIEYVKVTDTIKEVTIDTIPKIVYVERLKTIKGKDSIVYKDKPNDSTTEANQYNTKLESNNATADLKITTTGELLDVYGQIHYEKEIKTIETIKHASGLFIYTGTAIKSIEPEIGIIYSHKNKLLIGAGATYNLDLQDFNYAIKLGVKL